MSLCISYRTQNGKAVVLSDSRLTTIRKKNSVVQSANFLPSNMEILHQTDYGIKVQILTQNISGSTGSQFNIVVSIAGNVSLGLQCLAHIDACLMTNFILWAEDIPAYLEDKINEFWNNARDQSLQMSFVLNNHKGKTRIFELNADDNFFEFFEVNEVSGILISVIGDNAFSVKEKIFSEINRQSYTEDLNTNIHKSAITELKKEIESQSNLFVGGKIQGAIFNDNVAIYLKVKNEDGCSIRAAKIEDYEEEILEYPLLDLTNNNFEIKNYSHIKEFSI